MRAGAVLIATVFLLVPHAAPVRAAEEAAIAPDRPNVSTSAEPVPAGVVQIEAGVEYARRRQGGRPDERRFGVPVTLRAGLADDVEARLEGEPLVRLRGDADDTGPGDVSLGVKWRLLAAKEGQWWPALALLPSVKIPVAREPIGSGRADVTLLALASLELPWRLALDANAGVAAIGQRHPSGVLVQALVSASVSRSVLERLQVFGETFFSSRGERDGRDTVGVDAGAVYVVTRWLALDAAIETTLTGRGPDYALRAGVSVRLGR